MTLGQRIAHKFLGPRNFKGLYTKNPLAFTPAYYKFNRSKANLGAYRAPYLQKKKYVHWPDVFRQSMSVNQDQPFPNNKYTRNNKLLSQPLKDAIIKGHRAGKSAQALSLEFGLTVSRIDAVIRLETVRLEAEEAGTITHALRTYSRTMRKLFTTITVDVNGQPTQKLDNLTEIPLPQEALQQRFATIAESEPFGPVDAAKVLDIEPAAETLQRLVSLDDKAAAAAEAVAEGASGHSAVADASKTSTNGPKAFYAAVREGDRSRIRFTNTRVGKTGFRYGAARDDQKHARIVRFRPDGTRQYGIPEHT